MSDITDGLKRLAYQFKGSLKIEETLVAFLTQFEELTQVNNDLELLRYLDTAEGVQLDGVGEIVGLPRPEKPLEDLGLFGFLLDDDARGFGDSFDANLGGNFYDGKGIATAPVGDDLYRLLIRAKIIKNQTAMTVDDTTRLISFMFGGISVRYILLDDLRVRYDLGKILDQFETGLLEDIPLLIGLGDVTYHSMYNETPFAFESDPIGFGFGDIFAPEVGGNFARIIE